MTRPDCSIFPCCSMYHQRPKYPNCSMYSILAVPWTLSGNVPWLFRVSWLSIYRDCSMYPDHSVYLALHPSWLFHVLHISCITFCCSCHNISCHILTFSYPGIFSECSISRTFELIVFKPIVYVSYSSVSYCILAVPYTVLFWLFVPCPEFSISYSDCSM
jgi:hypothetical protein